MLHSLLQLSGFAAIPVKDGAEALAEIRKLPPDLIITDLLMPNVDGFELCRICKQNQELQNIPLIVYTATFNDTREEQLVKDLGADRYLIKPIQPDLLLQAINELLEKSATGSTLLQAQRSYDDNSLRQQHNAALLNKLHQKVSELESEIARRDAAEKLLRKNQSLIEIAARAGLMGGWSVDLATGKVNWSDEVARIHGMPAGYSPDVSEGIQFYAPEWREKITQVFANCVSHGIPYDEELEIISRNGTRKWVRTIGEAIYDEHGKITHVQGAFQDISIKKQAEFEHKALQQQLIEVQKLDSLGQFAGTIAHDFNNLLAIILGYTDIALSDITQEQPLYENIREIKNAGEKAAALTRQLLAFSRRQAIDPKKIDLNKSIRDIESMLRRLLGQAVSLDLHLAEKPGFILADPGQIDQIIMNLAANAHDAMSDGGRLTIETSSTVVDNSFLINGMNAEPGRYEVLTVSDTGCGIDEKTIERIFEPYFTTKGKGKGTGLGLAIVYGIVKQNKGYISVSSASGQGTAFKIFFLSIGED